MRSGHYRSVICKGLDGGETPDVPFDVVSFYVDDKMQILWSGR